MRIVTHVTQVYDWELVPPGTKVTPQDVASGKAKPEAGGLYSMRIVRPCPYNTCNMTEGMIIGKIFHERFRLSGGRVLSRRQAVAFVLAEHIYPSEIISSWIKRIEVEDSLGPDEKMFRDIITPHTESHLKAQPKEHLKTVRGFKDGDYTLGNFLTDAEAEAHVQAYLEPADAKAHVDHLHTHFKVKVSS